MSIEFKSMILNWASELRGTLLLPEEVFEWAIEHRGTDDDEAYVAIAKWTERKQNELTKMLIKYGIKTEGEIDF